MKLIMENPPFLSIFLTNSLAVLQPIRLLIKMQAIMFIRSFINQTAMMLC